MSSSLFQVASQIDIPPANLIEGTTVLAPILSMDKSDNLSRSGFFLEATQNEMIKIEDIIGDVQQGPDSFISTTRTRFHQITLQKAELEQGLRSKNLNPFKLFANHRIAREILAESKSLYTTTQEYSERMRRKTLTAIDHEELALVTTTPTESLDWRISGVAIPIYS